MKMNFSESRVSKRIDRCDYKNHSIQIGEKYRVAYIPTGWTRDEIEPFYICEKCYQNLRKGGKDGKRN